MRPVWVIVGLLAVACHKPAEDDVVDSEPVDSETDAGGGGAKDPSDFEIDPDVAQTYDATVVVDLSEEGDTGVDPGPQRLDVSFADVVAQQVHEFEGADLRVRDFIGRKVVGGRGKNLLSAELRVMVPVGPIQPGTYSCAGADSGGYSVLVAFYKGSQTLPKLAFSSFTLPDDSAEPCTVEITQSTLKRFVARVPLARVVGGNGTGGGTLEDVTLDLTLREIQPAE